MTQVYIRLTGRLGLAPSFTVRALLLGAPPTSQQQPQYLVPGVRNHITHQKTTIRTGNFDFLEGTFHAPVLLQHLQELEAGAASWDSWLKVSPLHWEVGEQPALTPLELALQEHLTAVQLACLQPRTHLTVEEEKLPIGRVHRNSTRALTHLASHSEDWETRTLRSVRPKRLMGYVREELLDLYENRVVVTLVDGLDRVLIRRIREIRIFEKEFEKATHLKNHQATGINTRQRRLYALWGEATTHSLELTQVKKLRRDLEELLHAIKALQHSPLYKALPRTAPIPTQLKRTNIFRNDPQYRRIALLYQLYVHHTQDQQTPEERQQHEQQACLDFDRYVLLLLVRALDQLQFRPTQTVPVVPGQTFTLRGPEGEVSVLWNADRTYHLQAGGTTLLRLVPVRTPLQRLTPSEQQAFWHELQNCAPGLPMQMVLVHPYLPEEPLPVPWCALPMEPTAVLPTVGCCPVNTTQLDSTERLARTVRNSLTRHRYLQYPYTVTPPDPRDIDEKLLAKGHGNARQLQAPLQAPQQKELLKPLNALQEEHHRLMAQRKQPGTGNSNSKALTRQIETLEAQIQQWVGFQEQLQAAQQSLQHLQVCPLCSAQEASFEGWGKQGFRCTCQHCGSQWGVKLCRHGKSQQVYIQAGRKPEVQGQVQPGWVDELLGRDVIDTPQYASLLPGAGSDMEFSCSCAPLT